MNIEEARFFCLKIKGCTESFPFDDTHLVFKVMDKMFALLSLDGSTTISLKCEPEYANKLREQYEGVEPAYHFNKKYWNQISLRSDIKDEKIYELIEHSVLEVIKKLPKKKQNEYYEL